jgi:iron-sulfur cluster repair protein YtfE (RIC family)
MSATLDPGQGPVAFFTGDHRRCDESWAAVESAADSGDMPATFAAFETFDRAMRLHLDLEEGLLFPALEAATAMRGGPTQVMRMEHDQMRGVLDQMALAVGDGDVDGVIDHGDTLLMLVQQHNLKEEGVLYPMAQSVLGAGWAPIAEKIRARYAP